MADADLILILETHATSLDNEAGLASGWFDVALSPTGEAQARELGDRRRGDDIAAVFCSDLVRAYRTAEIAFADRALTILRDRRLRECDYGGWTRRPATAIEAARAAHIRTPFPGGESYESAVARVAAWLDDISTPYAGKTVLVIGHRATYYALEHLLNDVPLAEAVTRPWRWQPGWRYSRMK